MYLLQGGEGPEFSGKEGEVEVVNQEGPIAIIDVKLDISLSVVLGTINPTTMKLLWDIGRTQVVILVDSGSSHNFKNSSIVQKSKLPVDTSTSLFMRITNGEVIHSKGLCTSVTIKLQGNHFKLFFYILSLGGYDAVLGVCCLQLWGPLYGTSLNWPCHLTCQ